MSRFILLALATIVLCTLPSKAIEIEDRIPADVDDREDCPYKYGNCPPGVECCQCKPEDLLVCDGYGYECKCYVKPQPVSPQPVSPSPVSPSPVSPSPSPKAEPSSPPVPTNVFKGPITTNNVALNSNQFGR